MDIQTLLGDMPKGEFVEQYFHRLPYSRPQMARQLCEIGTWETVGEVVASPDADVMVVREGTQYSGATPTNLEATRALSDEGYTVLIRHAERHSRAVAQLAEAFFKDFLAPIDVHMYVTPPGGRGFGWHYDAEDVFIIQTMGEKKYSLRKNTVHPWPIAEAIPHDMGYQREIMPLMRVTLAAGDWMYIPCGYWHKAEAADSNEPAISFAIGVMSRSAMDIYDFLRGHLLNSLMWRQRLPVTGSASSQSIEERLDSYRQLFAELGKDLNRMFQDERLLRAFVEQADASASVRKGP